MVTACRVFVVVFLVFSFLAVLHREAKEKTGTVVLLTTIGTYALFEIALCVAIWGRP